MVQLRIDAFLKLLINALQFFGYNFQIGLLVMCIYSDHLYILMCIY